MMTASPTISPTLSPTLSPTYLVLLTISPTLSPTISPTVSPTNIPTLSPPCNVSKTLLTFFTTFCLYWLTFSVSSNVMMFQPQYAFLLSKAYLWYFWGAEEGRGNKLGGNQQIPEEIPEDIIDVSAGSR